MPAWPRAMGASRQNRQHRRGNKPGYVKQGSTSGLACIAPASGLNGYGIRNLLTGLEFDEGGRLAVGSDESVEIYFLLFA